MTTVFIGGSRAVSKLNAPIRQRLDDLISRGCHIFVGDANGADKAVQQHLAARAYRNVIVFCMETCRNNIGDWETRVVRSAAKKRDFAYYAKKDVVMAQEAKCGVMLWDGKSKGTLHNVLNLVGASKKVLVYFAPEQQFFKLSSDADLQTLLARCNQRQIERLQSSLPTPPRQRHTDCPCSSATTTRQSVPQ